MKHILITILTLILCTPVLAQTNETVANDAAVVANSETNTPPPPIETHIYSDSVELGIKTRSAIYRGNVRLEDPRIHLTCEQLTADVPEEGQRVEQVVAETNVVIVMLDERGLTNRAYADKAVYTYEATDTITNETVELTGEIEPRIERPEGILYGNPIIWDRGQNKLRAKNQRMIYWGDAVAGTNAVKSDLPKAVKQQVISPSLNSNSVENLTPDDSAPTDNE